MSNWNDYTPEETTRLEPGNYRVEVVDVEETTSKSSGLPMLVITVRPNGTKINIKHYIVQNQYFNRNITQFFDSFGIDRGDFVFDTWIGATGGAKLILDDQDYLKVKWFLSQKQQEDLPEWDGDMPQRHTVGGFEEVKEIVGDDDLPF